MAELIKIRTEKTPLEVIVKVKENASDFGFIVRDVFDMAKQFSEHGVRVEEFEYYSIMLCNPEKAYKTIVSDPQRGAVLLPPKQVVVYKEDGQTVMAYMALAGDDVRKMLPGDEAFQLGLASSCNKIIELMEGV